MIPAPTSRHDLERRRALWILAGIVAVGAAFRFYNLGWGTPYKHFQIDEYSVTWPANLMRRSMNEAVGYSKFFMYSPLLMYLDNIARTIYELLSHPLNLEASKADQAAYMTMARGISALLGTLTIPVVYAIATRISTRRAGLFAAALLACAVLHLRDSHFATTDIAVTFFSALTLWLSIRLADRGDWQTLVLSGIAFGLTISTKYSGAFTLGVVGLAYLMAPGRPTRLQPLSRGLVWGLRGLIPIAAAAVVFVALNWMVFAYFDKFWSDITDWVLDPLRGKTTYAWLSQFRDIASPRLYWFTNLMWWSYGPALEIAGIIGVIWLAAKRSKPAALAAVFPVLYFVAASGTIAPFIRYMLPLAPALAIGAGVLLSDGLARPRMRSAALATAILTLGSTAVYATAYMNVFSQPDSRIEASRWIEANIPIDARILVEPAQNTPPMGDYFRRPDFSQDYLIRCNESRTDRYLRFTMDVYNRLFSQRLCGDDRGDDTDPQSYINAQLEKVDWIVIDDTNIQNYQHLPEAKYHVVKQYYRDLLGERLGFRIAKTFKVYPSLFGREINDDGAELTFRLFDHPKVYIFQRVKPISR